MSYDAVLAREWSRKNATYAPHLPQTQSSNTLLRTEQEEKDGPDSDDEEPILPPSNSGRRVSIFGVSHAIDAQQLMLAGINEDRESCGSSSSDSLSSSSSIHCPSPDQEAESDPNRIRFALVGDSGPEDDHIRQEMRRLSETSESRRVQVHQTNKQLKKAQQTLKELRKAIKLKVKLVQIASEVSVTSPALDVTGSFHQRSGQCRTRVGVVQKAF